MSPRGRIGTTGRKKSWEFVVSAIAGTQGDEVAEQLIEVLSEDLREGEEMPDIRFFFTLLGRRMARFGTAMVEASERHLDELADDETLRYERDETTSALASDYIAMRDGYRIGYSRKIAAAVGFEKHVATDPVAIELQTDRLLTNLEKPELELPPARYPGIAPRPDGTVALFRPNLKRLKTARAGLNRAHREADSSQMLKNDAVTAHDREFPNLSRCFEVCCVVAGLHDLARRVRPSQRRPGRRQEEVQEETAAASAEGSADEPPDDAAPGDAISGVPPSTAAAADSGGRQESENG